VDGLHAIRVRLDFAEPFRAYDLEAGDSIGGTPAVQFLERRDLGFLSRYDDLATVFVVNTVLVAELLEESGAANAVLGLERAGTVVDAGVDAAVVVARLVQAEGCLLFEDHASGGGEALGELEGSGEADNASADDGDVEGTARQESGP